MQEACAVDFTKWSRPPVSLRISVPLKEIRHVDLRERGYDNPFRVHDEFTQICPVADLTRIDRDALQEKLPFQYRVDSDGVIWYQPGSTVQTHYSLTHEKELDALNVPDYFSCRDWFPQDDYYAKRGALLERGQYGSRHISVFNHRGEQTGSTPTCRLIIPDDFETKFDIGEDGFYYSKLWGFDVSYTKGSSISKLQSFLDGEMGTIKDTYVAQAFKRMPSAYIRGDYAKNILNHGKKFEKAFRVAEEPVKRKDVQKAVRNGGARFVNLGEDRDNIGCFPANAFVNTRATGCTENLGFLHLGFRTNGDNVLLTPPHDTNPFLTPAGTMLVHKTADAWRFVFMSLMMVTNHMLDADRLRSFPALYMIPQYVHRNEVTFSTKAFRGVGLEIQEAIWATEGMSMAISRAMMGLKYEMSRKPKDFALNTDQIAKLPENHKIGMIGVGYAGYMKTGDTLRDYAGMLGTDGQVHHDGLYNLQLTSRHTLKFNRAVDLLDMIFWDLPPNSLVQAKRKVETKFVSTRNVRI
ncbi:hypothetical protein CC53_gp016 [Rhizobium phage vB_RleS_L338C]|uniref:hypothetical protein n=1 Tax=Rhizobium phage vB_RleS_L338C TaxID=1414737 RepID=UPI0003D8C3E1|nr:hypothetical protein CC53_gp016 [Rhizobium phage vB_RleS_L338C]AHC30433.1 hypothetical protein L338C_016 [Rhizobium phage vB_RleS_L338C]